MQNTSGFYALIEGELNHAPNFVSGPGFDLDVNNEQDKLNGSNGWKYFDSIELAKAYYGVE